MKKIVNSSTDRLSKTAQISIAIVVVLLATLWIFPMWRIEMRAPQYPAGLQIKIWINDIKGDVDIVNGLNHYIGMHTIRKQDFGEFVYLPAMMVGFMVLGLLVFIWNKKIVYYLWTLMFSVIGIFSFADFYKWEYHYGHNLDPNAPIKVPGMAYQPPLIGYKKLLNFEVMSQPDIAGWLYILTGVILVSITIYEWRRKNTAIVKN